MLNSQRTNLAAGIALFCALLAVIGAVLPWATVDTFLGDLSVSGTDGDGQIVIGLAIVAGLAVAGALMLKKRWLAVLAVVLGIVMAAITVYDWSELARLIEGAGADEISVGGGLVLATLGGIGFTLSSAYLALVMK